MVQFPSVPCTLRQPQENLLTMQDEGFGLSICIIRPTGVPGEQEWIIEQKSEDSIALKNLKHNKYAGVSAEPGENSQVKPVSDPFEFKVEPADGQHRYKLYVESDGQRLYVDYSMLRIYPPQCALIPAAFPGQPWELSFLE
ncbi:unnamed protein product [Rhizoctonia solani]|uniref:Uncharacterized protein n=1 Tax=Rhizoctonia solani TaxID=456999 RepID=A0A8H3H1W4_9AGAM|nr:unnamed protein product [Rhizoctonia solani]CAE6519071.1 unnamed protein product [Rhizoctonia solani]